VDGAALGRGSAWVMPVAVMVVPDCWPRTATISPRVNCACWAGFFLLPNVVCGVMVTVSVVAAFLMNVQVFAFSDAMVPKTALPP